MDCSQICSHVGTFTRWPLPQCSQIRSHARTFTRRPWWVESKGRGRRASARSAPPPALYLSLTAHSIHERKCEERRNDFAPAHIREQNRKSAQRESDLIFSRDVRCRISFAHHAASCATDDHYPADAGETHRGGRVSPANTHHPSMRPCAVGPRAGIPRTETAATLRA